MGKKGGSSTTTNVQSYQPTEQEIRLQKQAADYSEAVAPNALNLNNIAGKLLYGSYGTVQADYNKANQNAQHQTELAQSGVGNLINQQMPGIQSGVGNLINKQMSGIQSGVGDLINQQMPGIQSGVGDLINKQMPGIQSGVGKLINDQMPGIQSGVDNLISGQLPQAYQDNMNKSIASAVDKSVGTTVNDLGSRGVLNSSVTTKALNDASSNAANAASDKYLNSIGTLSGLYNQKLGGVNALSGLYRQQMDGVNTVSGLYGQQMNGVNALSGLYGQQLNGVGAISGLYNQQLNGVNALSGLYGQQAGLASQPIAISAAAQEAAQQPAMNLWASSLGLNSGGTLGALAGLAGTGTRTSTGTQKTSGGGGLFGGILGGLASGYAGALGSRI